MTPREIEKLLQTLESMNKVQESLAKTTNLLAATVADL